VIERMNVPKRFRIDDLKGIHYAVNIFVGVSVLWLILSRAANLNPIWAISAMIAAGEPRVAHALEVFRGRIINSMLGCALGLLFLTIGQRDWNLPFALAVAALVSAYVVRVPAHWRQAPITAALVIASAWAHRSKASALEIGLRRVAEVMLGCLVGLSVSWLMTKVWPLRTGDD